ncbi:hypothetical protein [Nocardia abscessus]|uniref:hypothetical protein n=1 Tax=Nocardia abscessus TaxID=120957 RepID=UPI000309F539|nr:hypothetical protein [Nocardia abscessus]MCC3326106.1 hypothetical protein [Nocardia abscessus]
MWCRPCDAPLALPDLVAALRDVQAHWTEWKRITANGHAVYGDAARTLISVALDR